MSYIRWSTRLGTGKRKKRSEVYAFGCIRCGRIHIWGLRFNLEHLACGDQFVDLQLTQDEWRHMVRSAQADLKRGKFRRSPWYAQRGEEPCAPTQIGDDCPICARPDWLARQRRKRAAKIDRAQREQPT